MPLVTRMESGIPELVREGENGYLVPIGDIAAFVERIQALLDAPDDLRNMSRRTAEYVSSTFRWNRTAAQYLDTLRRSDT